MAKSLYLKSAKNSFRRILILGFILILIGFISAYYSKIGLINSYSFELNGVNCVNEKVLENELKAKGQYFWQLNYSEIKNRIMSKYYCVGSISFDYRFPSQLRVKAESRIPFSQIFYHPSSKLNLTQKEASSSTASAAKNFENLPQPSKPIFLVDKSGVVFNQSYDDNYPIIFVPDTHLNLGYHFDQDKMEKASIVLDFLSNNLNNEIQFKNSIKQFKLSNNDLVVLAQPGVIFSVRKDVLRQLASLQLILAAAKINQRTIKYVDLRFDKPVVIYESPKKN